MEEYSFGFKNFDLDFSGQGDKKVTLTFNVDTEAPASEIDPGTVIFLTMDALCNLLEDIGFEPQKFMATLIAQRKLVKKSKEEMN